MTWCVKVPLHVCLRQCPGQLAAGVYSMRCEQSVGLLVVGIAVYMFTAALCNYKYTLTP